MEVTTGRTKKKASDTQITEAYTRLQNVWKVAEELGMCGQSIHERVVKLGINNPMKSYTDEQIKAIKERYTYYADRGILNVLAIEIGIEKTNMCRYARRIGLTNIHRKNVNSVTSRKIYNNYASALARCTNPNCSSYKNYGARGIEFRFNSYMEFEEYLLPTYQKGLSVDRIDNDGHYEKGNLRWSNQVRQARNTRNSIYVVLDGKEINLMDYCEKHNLNVGTIRNRIRRLKWDVKTAIETPIITQDRVKK